MQSLSSLTLYLCCLWMASLLYGEMLAYRVPLWSCSWPLLHSQQQQSPSTSSSKTFSFFPWTKNQLPNPKDQVNIAVLADPQLMDRTSLGLTPKSFALETVQFYTDIYMRRSFLFSILPFKPNLLLFLGDQFDGGPFLDDTEWEESLYRFRHIFDVDRRKEHNIKSYYLSGNHDIGYAGFHSQNAKAINRYEEAFGERDYRFTVHGVDFIVIDAQTLDGPPQGHLTLKSWEFIRSISKENISNPRILLTHIPLYRPDETTCGSFRSSPIINQRIAYTGIDRGIRYQNYLSEETSRRLLDAIKPVLVLSGHDHDHCTVSHSTSDGNVTEHTLGTVSWQQGNLYPSFMLLSVANPISNSTGQAHAVSTHLCFLPNQTFIYIWYIILFVITLFLLSFWPTHGLDWGPCGHWFKDFIRNIRTTTKEKDEDEEGEYEMVWDAEGSMHLVRKALPSVSHKTSIGMGLTGRGGVTARPQARKGTLQDPTNSVTVEVNAAEGLGRIRSSSSNAVKLIQRLFRVLRLLSMIAAVNLPLYMTLLFKDWIDR